MLNKLIFVFTIGVALATTTASACPEGQKRFCVTHKKTGEVHCGCSYDPDYKTLPKMETRANNLEQAYFPLSTENLACIRSIVDLPYLEWNINEADLKTAVKHPSVKSSLFSSKDECERAKNRLIQLHDPGVILSYAVTVTNHVHWYPKIADYFRWTQEDLNIRFEGIEFTSHERLK